MVVRNLPSVLYNCELRLARRVSVELGVTDWVDGSCTLDSRLDGMGGRGVATDFSLVVGISSRPVDVVDDCGSTWRTSGAHDIDGLLGRHPAALAAADRAHHQQGGTKAEVRGDVWLQPRGLAVVGPQEKMSFFNSLWTNSEYPISLKNVSI